MEERGRGWRRSWGRRRGRIICSESNTMDVDENTGFSRSGLDRGALTTDRNTSEADRQSALNQLVRDSTAMRRRLANVPRC